MKKFLAACFLAAALVPALWLVPSSAAPPALSPAAPEKHIVVVVMDGLRPDTVTAEDMPTLFALSKQGAFFAHHHAVYLSSTEVNGTAIATGSYPEHSGIIGNVEFRPLIDPLIPIPTENEAAIRVGDDAMQGHFLAVDTMAELVQHAGKTTAVAGTKGVAILQDRKARDAAATSVTIYAGQSLPEARLADITDAIGKFPLAADAAQAANEGQDNWTAQALTQSLWKKEVPALSVLWLSEPDYAQHATGPNSAVSKKALRSSDDRLATVIAALKAHNIYESTDLFVVSDHGFSTIARAIDTVVEFRKAGFPAARKFPDPPAANDILVVGNGGSVFLYVQGRAPETIQRLVQFLQSSDFAGAIFTKAGIPGTFKLSDALLNSDSAPDIAFSMRWKEDKNQFGLAGMVNADGTARGPGQGMHVTLSKYDMHNTLIAEGPDIKKGFVDDLPSGNIDIAPTVLSLLGIAPAKPMDGRVLTEAFPNGADPGKPETKRIEAAATINGVKWTQYLQRTSVAGRIYLDEGNGGN